MCRNCDVIHHVTPFDQAPAYSVLGGEIQEASVNDWRDFVTAHAGHMLEPLKGTGEKYFPSGSVADPMAVCYIEVTNGAARMLLKRTRARIDEPVRFQRLKGFLADSGVTLEIQENEIKNEMKYHFSWAPLSFDDEKIARFVRLFKESVKDIDPRSVRVTEYSYSDDNISYGVLEDFMIDALLAKCAANFIPEEIEFIRRFVETHRGSSDVMALLMRRRMTVLPST